MTRSKNLVIRYLIYGLVGLTLLLIFGGFQVLIQLTKDTKKAQASGLDTAIIFDLINQERQKAGASKLLQNQILNQSAIAKAGDMVESLYFAHYNPVSNKRGLSFITDGGYQYMLAGENLAVYYDTESSLVQGWMNSPTHRSNILNKDFVETGIGLKKVMYQGFETQFVVQFFAVPLTQQSQPVTPKPVEKPQSDLPVENPQQSSSSVPVVAPLPEKISQEEVDTLVEDLRKAFSRL